MADIELAKRHPIAKRLIDAIYEIGILQITFAPLDWVFAEHSGTKTTGHFAIFFLVVGVLLLGGSIFLEWMLTRGE